MLMSTRLEKDTLGVINIPNDRLWGAQTQRALKHFQISNEEIMPLEIIKALAQIKRVAAQVNKKLGLLSSECANAISLAADQILEEKYNKEFILTIWQSGSGTQTHMNMNEVLANIASELLGGIRGKHRLIHPNDDVNKGQSSNDVFPTAMHMAAVTSIKEVLLPKIKNIKNTLEIKSKSFKDIIKIGRTHLQDALPLTLGQEISGWVQMLENGLSHINNTIPYLYELAIGGTAVGTGINTHTEFAVEVSKNLAELTGHPFIPAKNKFEALSTCDALVYSHGSLKSLATSIIKIANDIRWLASGPRCGIGEIKIPANEPGSSIMPGKINPTQCEVLMMICYQILGNDTVINIAGASGNFELNVSRPIIIYNFLQSIRLLANGLKSFNKYCVMGIEPNYKRIEQLLNESLMLATILNNHLGYDKVATIVKMAYNNDISIKESAIQLGYINERQFEEWVNPKNMIQS
ncbi:class II fumarate hydratase [Candidatus Schneideria nysicola]|uniref:class II fumarate hydratase n=1 Tax=Candidatus Schneideria nysicola TaxID=1081631 RepID=UPI001CAA7DBE|nr:class II fumarate hydratase [Candidatus Schneideria nysicola]UAJ65407.1 class II fumarate hydratase [Candidatus Schneideria nysicola]